MTPQSSETGLLFDMDGTLLDSTLLVEMIWTGFAGRHDLLPADVMAFAHGRPTHSTVTHFLGGPDGPGARAEVARISAQEAQETDGIVAVRGAESLLASLDTARWAIVTSATREVATSRMRAAGLPVPDVLVTSEDVIAGKPSPEGYLQAARALGRSAAACVVFEDAAPGILAGRAAGAVVVVVGDCADAAADGLLRVPDLSDVAARGDPLGAVRAVVGA